MSVEGQRKVSLAILMFCAPRGTVQYIPSYGTATTLRHPRACRHYDNTVHVDSMMYWILTYFLTCRQYALLIISYVLGIVTATKSWADGRIIFVSKLCNSRPATTLLSRRVHAVADRGPSAL